MKVGIPSEIFPSELRVAATPKTVKRLQKQGFEVYIQHNAGIKANFSDQEFEEAQFSEYPHLGQALKANRYLPR